MGSALRPNIPFAGLKMVYHLFFIYKRGGKMSNFNQPLSTEQQIEKMKKYVTFTKKVKMRKMIAYTGYFRTSRYGKYVISYSNKLKKKPDQELLFAVYNFDTDLRKLLFQYCKRAEIQFKSHLVNSVSIKEGDSVFYLNEATYTPTKGERDKISKLNNKKFFEDTFYKNLTKQERLLRTKTKKYPELKDYRTGGRRARNKIPAWAAFSYFELGIINNIYGYLRLDLKKAVLVYGYSKTNYSKTDTRKMDTWLDAIRNLRNVCAHHNKLVGKTSSVVLLHNEDEENLLTSETDLFSRLYALKKVLNTSDSLELKSDLSKLIKKAKFDIHLFEILPEDWEQKFDSIKEL